jgi:hypothetical protein
MNTPIDHNALTKYAMSLANQMLSASQKLQLFAVLGVYPRYSNKAISVEKGWAGPEKPDSGAPMIARMKALQLLSLPGRVEFALTPRPELKLGPDFDYPGGVMKVVDDRRYIATGSAQSGTTDLMFSSTWMYAMQWYTKFNHFGIRHPNENAMHAAIAVDQKLLGEAPIYSTAGQDEGFHHRYYFPIIDGNAPHGIYYREHQWFPNKSASLSYHWDVVTEDPKRLLKFVGMCLSSEPTIWGDDGTNGPIGMVTTDNRGMDVSIMARSLWFTPQQQFEQ